MVERKSDQGHHCLFPLPLPPPHGYFHSFEKHLMEPLPPIHIYQPNEKGPLRTFSPNPLSYTWETQTQREGSFHHTGSCYEVSDGDLSLSKSHTLYIPSAAPKSKLMSHMPPQPHPLPPPTGPVPYISLQLLDSKQGQAHPVYSLPEGFITEVTAFFQD